MEEAKEGTFDIAEIKKMMIGKAIIKVTARIIISSPPT
jgi:hypothetical protein